MERVAGEADPRELRERLGSAGGRRRRRLDEEHCRSLAEHQPVAVGAERPARLGGESSEPREARECDARERVGTTGENRVCPSEPDEVECVAEGVVAGGARSGEHGDAAAEAELGRDVLSDPVRARADELLRQDGSRPDVRRIPRLEPAALSHRGADREADVRFRRGPPERAPAAPPRRRAARRAPGAGPWRSRARGRAPRSRSAMEREWRRTIRPGPHLSLPREATPRRSRRLRRRARRRRGR